MIDDPPARLIIEQVQTTLAGGECSRLEQKIAGNALGIVLREGEYGPIFAEQEGRRIKALLGEDGDLAVANHTLSHAIQSGVIADQDGLINHLIRTTIGKLIVDQPGYPGFRALREETLRGGDHL